MSERTVRRRLSKMNLKRRTSVVLPSTMDRAIAAVKCEVGSRGMSLGYRAMKMRIQLSYGISLSREHIRRILTEVDPEGVDSRRRGQLHRREYVNCGPNYLIHVDGYDKLKRFGLCIHGAIDGYSKKLLWLQVAQTNNNPSVVGWNFTNFMKDINGVPRCVRMDRGTENTLIEDIQSVIREQHTDDMHQKSVLYGSSNHNQPIERWWRTCRQFGVQFLMSFFKDLEDQGFFETGQEMHLVCVRYCFMDIVQQILNDMLKEWNSQKRRKRDVPNVLYSFPQKYGTVDYKTAVDISEINEVMELCNAPLQRGCVEEDRQDLDELVQQIYGRPVTPYSLEEARDMYLKLIQFF